MHISGFRNTPVSQILVFWVIGASILASVTDIKYYFYIQVDPHLWKWRQYWRLLVWQACYTNSTEVLVAASTFYHLRVIERLWGSRKFASFIILTLPFTLLLPPLLALILAPLKLGYTNYIPAGPTPLVFALLAQYHAAIPALYHYRIGTSSPSAAGSSGVPSSAFSFSSKSSSYVLPIQLALSQLPASVIPALVGWAVGYGYRHEVLPGTAWRVPGWVVGQSGRRDARRMEALRRRLEGEAEGYGTGADMTDNEGSRRRWRANEQDADGEGEQ